MDSIKKDEFKILKKIKDNNIQIVSIIEFNGTKALLKQVKENNVDAINMLKNEVNILYKLKDVDFSPNLLYYKFDEINNYIIIELFYGKRINKLSKLNLKERVLVMIELINVVNELHSLNIIHCDLKPENILITLDKKIKILDYGISIVDGKNYFINYYSPSYCSLQQILKKEITEKSDLYSLGIIFYVLLFNKFPFTGSKEEINKKKLRCNFDKCNNDLLNFIFLKLFGIDNKMVYQSLDEFKKDLLLMIRLIN